MNYISDSIGNSDSDFHPQKKNCTLQELNSGLHQHIATVTTWPKTLWCLVERWPNLSGDSKDDRSCRKQAMMIDWVRIWHRTEHTIYGSDQTQPNNTYILHTLQATTTLDDNLNSITLTGQCLDSRWLNRLLPFRAPICPDGEQTSRPLGPSWCLDADLPSDPIIRGPDILHFLAVVDTWEVKLPKYITLNNLCQVPHCPIMADHSGYKIHTCISYSLAYLKYLNKYALTTTIATYVKYVKTFACQNYLCKIVVLCISISGTQKQTNLSYVNSSDMQMYWHIGNICSQCIFI